MRWCRRTVRSWLVVPNRSFSSSLPGVAIATDALKTEEARSATLSWLEESEFELVSLDLRDTAATVVLAGTGEPPSAQMLATNLSETLGRSIDLNLQWIPRNRRLVSSE